jgi:DNA invertase Pin-like site-specific DNA recombinase
MFGALAEFERSLIRECTQAGLVAARRAQAARKNVHQNSPKHRGRRGAARQSRLSVTQIAHRLGVSPATLYRYIPAARSEYPGFEGARAL